MGNDGPSVPRVARLQQSLEDEIKETGPLLWGSAVRAKGLRLSPRAYAHEILQAAGGAIETVDNRRQTLKHDVKSNNTSQKLLKGYEQIMNSYDRS